MSAGGQEQMDGEWGWTVKQRHQLETSGVQTDELKGSCVHQTIAALEMSISSESLVPLLAQSCS